MLVHDDELLAAAQVNMTAAADFGRRGKVAEQKTLLDAALLLAEFEREPVTATDLRQQVAALEMGNIYDCRPEERGQYHDVEVDNMQGHLRQIYGDTIPRVGYWPLLQGWTEESRGGP